VVLFCYRKAVSIGVWLIFLRGAFAMGLNDAPSGERIHIGFFGRRNAGKSSVVNAVTNQDLAVVSDTKGTTTDPVTKAMELLPLGPVVIIDTPGGRAWRASCEEN
jgi:tRNA U34 5-carboxymethylaminomethyl modifying GTPase MnmE/TrmE